MKISSEMGGERMFGKKFENAPLNRQHSTVHKQKSTEMTECTNVIHPIAEHFQ